MNRKPVVITTEHRGVFFGYVEDDSKAPNEMILSNARMCVYWSADTRGVLGLAGAGPGKESRVTHAIPQIKLYKVTAVFDCSPEAAEKWEQAIWK